MTNAVKPPTHGELLVALSNQIVGVYKELYGKGPVKVRSWYLDDIVLCVLRGGLTRSEQVFMQIGRDDRVALQRDTFHEAVAPVFIQAVEELTGRRVETLLHSSDGQHDVSTLVFLLESREDAALNASDEGLKRKGEQVRKKARDVREHSRKLRDRHVTLQEKLKNGPGAGA